MCMYVYVYIYIYVISSSSSSSSLININGRAPEGAAQQAREDCVRVRLRHAALLLDPCPGERILSRSVITTSLRGVGRMKVRPEFRTSDSRSNKH